MVRRMNLMATMSSRIIVRESIGNPILLAVNANRGQRAAVTSVPLPAPIRTTSTSTPATEPT
jgi:hypothetical protein